MHPVIVRMGRTALDVLLPPQCLSCDLPVGRTGQLCTGCFRRTTFISEPCCHGCGRAFENAGLGGPVSRCIECVETPPAWEEARSAFVYDEQARRILLPFKWGDRTEMARGIAPMMARAGAALLARADLLVPVPLHRWRLLARRYNQSALLAQALGRLSGRMTVLDGLLRVRRTPSLGDLTRVERAAALEGAISANRRRLGVLMDARVLLIDDVLTTGATARACTEALLAAGVASVDVLTAARVAGSGGDGGAGPSHSGLAGRYAGPEDCCMPMIEIYTQPWCPYCARAIALLQKKNVAYREIEAPHGTAERAEAVRRSGGSTSVPQIFIGSHAVGGCDDLMALERAGKLDALLA